MASPFDPGPRPLPKPPKTVPPEVIEGTWDDEGMGAEPKSGGWAATRNPRYRPGQTDANGRVICGAMTHAKDRHPCGRDVVEGRDRCDLHGGKTLTGVEVAAFKDGIYSKARRQLQDMAERVDQIKASPEFASVDDEIALVRWSLDEFLAQFGHSSSIPVVEVTREMAAEIVGLVHKRVQILNGGTTKIQISAKDYESAMVGIFTILAQELEDDPATRDRIAARIEAFAGARMLPSGGDR